MLGSATESSGKFVMRVDRVDDEWVSGVVVAGKAKAMLKYNEVYEGEPITVRRSFCAWSPLEVPADA